MSRLVLAEELLLLLNSNTTLILIAIVKAVLFELVPSVKVEGNSHYSFPTPIFSGLLSSMFLFSDLL